jgi:hypothetical protein
MHLESMVKYLMQNQNQSTTTHQSTASTGDDNDNEYSAISVASNQPTPPMQSHDSPPPNGQLDTRYVGSTHWSAILDDIQELKAVVTGAGGSDNENDLQDPETTVTPPSPPDLSRGELIFGTSKSYSLQHIIGQYLPPKVEVDRFVATYFRGEVYILPFVHTYHFQRQYQDFWTYPDQVNPLWLSMLFSICCMADVIGGKGANGTDRTTPVYHQSPPSVQPNHQPHPPFHVAAAQCLVLGEYHRPQQYTVEALTMYAHCKNLKSLEPSREAGAILGVVVRMGYEMGYHRDPDTVGCGVFDGEMRRRFWSTCKQMDLMLSFMLGLPSNICLENCDTKAPRNLLDSEFDEHTKVLPPSRSETEPTKLLWFIVKDRLMVNFGRVCRDALSFTSKTEQEVSRMDQEIQQTFASVPDVLRARPLADSIADPPFLVMTRLYIEFIYLKSVCVLHRRYNNRPKSGGRLVEAATKLVGNFLDMYKEFAPGGQLYVERWMLTNFTMNDFLLGVMVLCLVLHTRWKRGGDGGYDLDNDGEVISLLHQSLAICVEKSSVCRDAWRASHAVRLTLNRADQQRQSGQTAAANTVVSHADDNMFVEGQSDLELPPLPDAFGPWDPFSFLIDDDLDGLNWLED